MYMAIDQYGNTEHGLEFPRKELLERMGVKRASKMYQDKKDGSSVHIGYVISGRWFILFKVTPFEKAV